MKISELTDVSIEEPNVQLLVDMPNGTRVAVLDYYYDIAESGRSIIVLRTGKETKKCKY
jgi:hypothetical protein